MFLLQKTLGICHLQHRVQVLKISGTCQPLHAPFNTHSTRLLSTTNTCLSPTHWTMRARRTLWVVQIQNTSISFLPLSLPQFLLFFSPASPQRPTLTMHLSLPSTQCQTGEWRLTMLSPQKFINASTQIYHLRPFSSRYCAAWIRASRLDIEPDWAILCAGTRQGYIIR